MSYFEAEWTDAEVAVTIDSLAKMRDDLKAQGHSAPNVESALRKLTSIIKPDTAKVRLEGFGRDIVERSARVREARERLLGES